MFFLNSLFTQSTCNSWFDQETWWGCGSMFFCPVAEPDRWSMEGAIGVSAKWPLLCASVRTLHLLTAACISKNFSKNHSQVNHLGSGVSAYLSLEGIYVAFYLYWWPQVILLANRIYLIIRWQWTLSWCSMTSWCIIMIRSKNATN